MTATSRLRLLLPTLAVVALLAACAPTGTSGGDGGSGGNAGGTDSGGDSSSSGGADCSAFTGEDAPFTSAAVLEAPADGATWGDGSDYSFTVTPEAAAEVPQLSFLGITSGSVVDASSAFLEDEGSNVFSATGSSLFNSDFDGQAGIAKLFIVTDVTFDGAKYDGDTTILGQYCVTFAVAE